MKYRVIAIINGEYDLGEFEANTEEEAEEQAWEMVDKHQGPVEDIEISTMVVLELDY